ncbi:DUF4118 domain-containing protein [Clostridium sp. KNHs216]|uniref:sensor histidine kinase n=1 Tax=Clostridium sp. KNHs216 TaxID=1550235 RepID=UPI0011528261|nr:DUF4118 domain-containing protein [Clostridium sp. KNHs216]TQI67557.1 two-component system sensor histidine kinase KdpD [Clostridium sp. KNHs216]
MVRSSPVSSVSFLRDALKSIFVLGAATSVSFLIVKLSGSYDHLAVVYVLAVVLVSRFTAGYLWGILAAITGVIGTNYYFTYPYHAFNFTISGYPVTFISMLAVSIVTSAMTARIKEQARLSEQREKRTENLYEFSKKLVAAGDSDQVVALTLEYLCRYTRQSVIFYLTDPLSSQGTVKSTCDHHRILLDSKEEKSAAHQAFTTNVKTSTKDCLYLPLSSQEKILGVAGLVYENEEKPEPGMLTFFDLLLSQAALALEHRQLAEKQQRIMMEAEKETMRTNLLRAVSHDLRTPLTSILGASAAIAENRDLIDPAAHDKLISDIHEEAEWLIRIVENLLTVTRISQKPAALKKYPEAAEEIVAEAVGRIRRRYPRAEIHVSVPSEFLMVPMDATLIEQVIINLLENSIGHAGKAVPIGLEVFVEGDQAVFRVSDKGKGIPEEELSCLFTGTSPAKNKSSDSSRGNGIGLTICMSIVKAHGGKMTAKNRKDGGAAFTFVLPLGGAEPDD